SSFWHRVVWLARLIGRRRRGLVALLLTLIALNTVAGAALSLSLKWMINGGLDGNHTLAIRAAVIGAIAAGVLASAGRGVNNLQLWLAVTVAADVDEDTLALTARMPSIEHLERSDYLDQIEIIRQGGADLILSAYALTDLVSFSIKIAVAVWLL